VFQAAGAQTNEEEVSIEAEAPRQQEDAVTDLHGEEAVEEAKDGTSGRHEMRKAMKLTHR